MLGTERAVARFSSQPLPEASLRACPCESWLPALAARSLEAQDPAEDVFALQQQPSDGLRLIRLCEHHRFLKALAELSAPGLRITQAK